VYWVEVLQDRVKQPITVNMMMNVWVLWKHGICYWLSKCQLPNRIPISC
jgi:hypothetical protein